MSWGSKIWTVWPSWAGEVVAGGVGELVEDACGHNIDAALTRIRDAADDVRHRAKDQAGDWQETLEHAGDDLRVELGRRSVRAQSSPEALKELAGEIRKRQAELAA